MRPEEFKRLVPYPLDPFQERAIEALFQGTSVLVSVPTGAGKTLVAEYAVRRALHGGGRALYTTPLKALSNQKFRDFRDQLGDDRVGLVTGDVSIRPEAPLLVMTTEILRNWLVAGSDRLNGVSDVVLDEAHYLGDEGRGSVWEETIIFLPAGIILTALSATLPNAEEIAGWVSSVHRPMIVVAHDQRPVPLHVCISSPRVTPWKGRLPRHQAETPVLAVLHDLRRSGLLPALIFRFSRAGCEALADEAAETDWTTREEQAQIESLIQQVPKELKESPASQHWLNVLPTGVAPHHAGLLPPLKVVIEKAFQRGLLKAVFATETLAAGIHMPAKTVVLADLVKPSPSGDRLITVSEYRQMTGRAGRRGLDAEGYAVIHQPQRYRLGDLRQVVEGEPDSLWSSLRLSYSLVANLTQRFGDAENRWILERSLHHFQRTAQRPQLASRLFELDCLVTEALAGEKTAEDLVQARFGPLPGWLAEKAALERELLRLDQGQWPVFEAMQRVLAESGFLKGGRWTPKGAQLAQMRGEQELLSVVALDVLPGLKASEAAGLVSALVADSHRELEPIHGPLQAVLDHLVYEGRKLNRLQEAHGLYDWPCRLDRSLAAPVMAWAAGRPWREVTHGLDEGEFQWHLRQVLDRLQQLARLPGLGPDQLALLEKTIRLIDRGVVRLVL